jgi:hypothetical protein
MPDKAISDLDTRRAAARRTAAILGGVAVLVFVMFCLKAVKVF